MKVKYKGESIFGTLTENCVYKVVSIHGECYSLEDEEGEIENVNASHCEIIDDTTEQKPWYKTGELPPVGEILENIETGHRVEIACHFHGSAVYWDFNAGEFSSGLNEDFKPLKSQEEIEKEKFVDGMYDHIKAFATMSRYKWTDKEVCEYLYDKGYRKTK